METISLNLYSFGELSEEAQERVIEREGGWISQGRVEIDQDDWMETLERVEKALGIKVKDWEVGLSGYRFGFSFKSSAWNDLADEARYLLRYLDEKESYFRKGKYYSTPFKYEAGKAPSCKSRVSKIMFRSDYPLTGMWTDGSIGKSWENRWDAVRRGDSIREFVQDMLEDFFMSWQREIEYAYTDEAVASELEEMGFSYLEDGTKYELAR